MATKRGTRGRRRTPTATIKLREGKVYGSTWGDRSNEPQPAVGIPDCPVQLDGLAKQTWDRLVPLLAAVGCLTDQDAESLALGCKMFAVAMDPGTPETTMFNAVREWRQVAAMFGLNPADRSRIQIEKRIGKGPTSTRDRSKDKHAG